MRVAAWAWRLWCPLTLVLGATGCDTSPDENPAVAAPGSVSEQVPVQSSAPGVEESQGFVAASVPPEPVVRETPAEASEAEPSTASMDVDLESGATEEPTTQPAIVPASERCAIENRGVWIVHGGLIAQGTGSEWQFHRLQLWGRQSSIWGPDDRDVWVIGAEAFRFDGGAFRAVGESLWGPSADPYKSFQFATNAWGTSADDVWATAANATLPATLSHFNGTSWQQVEGVVGGVQGIWSSAPDDVWVSDGTLHRFDGAQWTVDGDHIGSPWGTAADDVWVGMRWHFDGEQWTEYESEVVSPYQAGAVRVRGGIGGELWGWYKKLYRFDGTGWIEAEQPPNLANQVDWTTNATVWSDFYPSGSGLWAVGASIVKSVSEPTELPVPEMARHVLYNAGDGWRDVTPEAFKVDTMVDSDAYPTIWIAPSSVQK